MTHLKVSVFLLCACSLRAALTPQLSDNFNDNSTDTTLWSVGTVGVGPSIQEAAQRLEVTIPGTSQQGQGPYGTGMAAYYMTQDLYTGDFDARVGFQLLNWPSANGVRVGLSVGVWQNAERDSVVYQNDGRDAYVMSLWPGLAIRDTTDRSGILRLVRNGNAMSGFFWDSNLSDWVQIGSSIYPAGDKYFTLAVWTDNTLFARMDVAVAFDNFSVTPGGAVTPVPEPSTIFAGLLALLPLGAGVLSTLRRRGVRR